MEQIKISDGVKLKVDIISDQGVFLLPKDTVLTEEHIELLRKHRYQLTDKDIYTESEQPQNTYKKDVDLSVIEDATKVFKTIFDEVRYSNKLPFDEIKQNILPVIAESTEHRNYFELLHALQAKDDYTYRHNIGVAVISTILGKWLGFDDEELSHLTTAALLHDVGKMKVSEHILHKPGKLTKAEFEEMMQHTVYGYELLKETPGVSERTAVVALQHHEREDGGGYPYGLKGDRLDYFSKIVAVADVFHAMTSKRVYQDPLPFYEAVNQLRQDELGRLHPKIVNTFLNKTLDTLVGKDVLLSTGERGKVLLVNPNHPSRPLVQVNDKFIDLSKDKQLHLMQVLH
ncbi:HD-GYP domain-containing protein [Caldalkalibacillus salinus]|uniref:HD-GYP domain-containing protein n=1 Tax=Caldalkalibacillus salinus TaxID=2803787 RepID=UPI0019240FDA|nr:HD-GYP domain-containing protein [Caldalkalibacillus salinus]